MRAANLALVAAGARATRRLRHALDEPERAQAAILRGLVARNRTTWFGEEHDFAGVRSLADYRARVPLRTYDDFEPWIDRVAAGEPRVLTAAPVRFLEPTGGSSGPVKLVPYTDDLLREFAAATLPWVADLLRRPGVRAGRSYWAVSPPTRRPATTDGGLAIGAASDADYFPRVFRPLLGRTLVVPAASPADWQGATLLALLAAEDLALVSVWSPSFLTALAAVLDERFEQLVRDLETFHPRRAATLRSGFGASPPEDLGELWPRLALVSCWADGHATRALAGLRRRFPHVPVQGKGLLATEGVVSVPLSGANAPIAAVGSHLLEFLPEGDVACPLLAHELEPGVDYEVVLSTGGGLYRYRLRDLVRVVGRLGRTATLRFVGRTDAASDLAGEKLTPALVELALRRAGADELRFVLLAPALEPVPHYVLYAEPAPGPFPARVEELLCEAHHYALCRRLGQLGPVRGVAVRDGERVFERTMLERGSRAGTIKPVALDADTGWAARFEAGERAAA